MADKIVSTLNIQRILPPLDQPVTYQRALGIITILVCQSSASANWNVGGLYKLLKESLENNWYEIFFDESRRPNGCRCWHNDHNFIENHISANVSLERYQGMTKYIDICIDNRGMYE